MQGLQEHRGAQHDIYAKNRTRVPSREEGRGREHLGFYVTAFTLGNLTHHRRQPKPPTPTGDSDSACA
eukprot:COSAG01_NODE_586_length_15170_cov_32.511512_2_plen_68_part_00